MFTRGSNDTLSVGENSTYFSWDTLHCFCLDRFWYSNTGWFVCSLQSICKLAIPPGRDGAPPISNISIGLSPPKTPKTAVKIDTCLEVLSKKHPKTPSQNLHPVPPKKTISWVPIPRSPSSPRLLFQFFRLQRLQATIVAARVGVPMSLSH